ncbi:MAG: hypothetical protein ACOZIN_11430 [Myxococcota bacterium]
MLPLSLALVTALTATQPSPRSVAVLVARTTGVSQGRVDELAKQVGDTLSGSFAVPMDPTQTEKRLRELGLGDAAACKGKAPCLAGLGKALGVDAVVALTMSVVLNDFSFHAEALQVPEGRALGSLGFIAPVKEPLDLSARLSPLIAELSRALPPVSVAKAEPPKDVPLKPPTLAKLAPLAPATPAVNLETPARSRLPAYAAAGVATAAAVAATVLAVAAFNGKAEYDANKTNKDGPTLSLSEAKNLVKTTNSNATAALLVGTLAVGLGVTAGVLW